MFSRARFAISVSTRAVLPLVAALVSAGCRDAAGPGEAAVARMSVSVWAGLVEPTLTEEQAVSGGRRFVHNCPVTLEVRAGGSPQARVRLLGARWIITPPAGQIGSPTFRFTGALRPEEVARTFGGQELAGGATVHAQVSTSLSFAPGPEPRGRVGMHHARWEVDYETARQTHTAAVDLECGAALVRPRWPVVDARTGLPALYVPIRMADSTWLSDDRGEAGAHLPAGAHRYEVLGSRWAPTSGVADTRSPRDEPIRVRRLAPEIEPGSFTAECNADGSVCTAGVTAYDPSGAASLPDSVPLSLRSVAVDAHRRRYEFRTSRSQWGVALFEVRLTSATGLQARYHCGTEHPALPTGCGEFAPPGFPAQWRGAPR